MLLTCRNSEKVTKSSDSQVDFSVSDDDDVAWVEETGEEDTDTEEEDEPAVIGIKPYQFEPCPSVPQGPGCHRHR